MERKRPRFEAWLQGRRGPREPELERALLAAVDAFDVVNETGKLQDEELRLILDAASSSRALLWMNVVDLLGKLSEQWPAAAEAVMDMSRSPKAHVRFNALCCLKTGTPNAVVNTVLKAGLVDRSSRVRWKAADRTEGLEKINLIPELTAAFEVEQNAKTRNSIEHHLLLLRDGYIVEQEPDGGFQVTARTRGGIIGRGVTAEEFRAKGIGMIVSELREWNNGLFGEG